MLVAQPALCCLDVSIKISPSTLNLDSNGRWVTVHAEIPAAIVDRDSVMLEGISAGPVFADDCGDLVAKFPLEDIKDILTPSDYVELTLTGDSEYGSFVGTDAIRVIESKGKGKGK
jgi:hypothetical protein